MGAGPAAATREVVDLTIVGAGPAGLAAAFWAGMREASCRLVDSLGAVGGQLTALYSEKPVYDVLGHPRVLAKDLVAALHEQAVGQFGTPVLLQTTVTGLARDGDAVVLQTSRGELRSRAVIVAAGHGAVEPRRLPELDLAAWEGRGATYLVERREAYAGRRVAIVGGGDSALDWTLDLLDVAAHVDLVHRRERFRAHDVTVRRVLDAVGAGRVALHVPYRVRAVAGDGGVERVLLEHARGGDPRELACDALLLQLGFQTRLEPLQGWGLELERGSVVVDPTMRTSLPRVWACGDATAHAGKLKLIATGFAEAAVAVAQAVHEIRPDTQLQPGYSTHTGVPGVVAGEP